MSHPTKERYLVVSDLHLADVEDHGDGWKYFKGSRYVFDEDLAALLRVFATQGDGPGTLILNGDIVDFDLVTAVPDDPPWPVRRSERRRGLDATPEKSAWKLSRILEHHPVFVDALGIFLAGGNRVVWILGNHDRELHFPVVRDVLRDALAEAAGRAGGDVPDGAFAVEPWFYHVPGRIYAEHGQQYDYYNSFRHILEPVVTRRGAPEIALPMGNISNRLLMGRMGYFNPHAGDYILNVFSYFLHWARLYAFSRHNLLFIWFFGSLLALGALLGTKRRLLRQSRQGDAVQLEALRHRMGLAPADLEGLRRLQRPPITDRVFRIVREFWIDRLVIAALMTGGTVALALVPIPLWIKLMVPLSCFPLVYFLYEALVQGETVFSAADKLTVYASKIGAVLRVPVVTFGHTHEPRAITVGPGITYVNSGTWAPVTAPYPKTDLLPGFRNWLEVDFSEDPPRMRFDCLLGPAVEQRSPHAS
ncbi:MAG: metallophosphoesterase [Pseudomonadota bacterium]